jgi:hypothetical protein
MLLLLIGSLIFVPLALAVIFGPLAIALSSSSKSSTRLAVRPLEVSDVQLQHAGALQQSFDRVGHFGAREEITQSRVSVDA